MTDEPAAISATKQQEAIDIIMDVLLRLHWHERCNVFLAVKHNPIFCTSCGYGEIGSPNPYCQCENDE